MSNNPIPSHEILIIGDVCEEILYDNAPKKQTSESGRYVPRLYQMRPAKFIPSGIWQTEGIMTEFQEYATPDGSSEDTRDAAVHAVIRPEQNRQGRSAAVDTGGVNALPYAAMELGDFPAIHSSANHRNGKVSRIHDRKFYNFKPDSIGKSNKFSDKEKTKRTNEIKGALDNIQSDNVDLVIVDLDLGFREINLEFLNDYSKIITINIILAHHLPDLITAHHHLESSDRPGDFADEMWNSLFSLKSNKDTTYKTPIRVFTSASVLRAEAIDISRDISIERTAANFAHAIAMGRECAQSARDKQFTLSLPHRHMAQLTHFDDLIVRFGFTGVGHYYRDESKDEPNQLDFFYDALPPKGMFRDSLQHGFVQGKESTLVAQALRSSQRELDSDRLCLAEGLVACQRLFDTGYKKVERGDEPYDINYYKDFSKSFYAKDHVAAYKALNIPVGKCTIEIGEEYRDEGKYFGPKGPLVKKRILKKRLELLTISNNSIFPKDLGKLTKDMWLATAIATCIVQSPEDINSNDKLHKFLQVPLCQIGNLLTFDRDEIEGLRSAQNLIRQYLSTIAKSSDRSSIRPFSMAIFGPPGSGKSFASKELCGFAKHAKQGYPKIVQNTFNVAEFQSRKDLQKVAIWCREQAVNGAVPIVLLDEFDAVHNSASMGWLKDFLPIMEDGEFKSEEDGVLKLGPGIFIFAGGINYSHKEFLDKIFDKDGNLIPDPATKLPVISKGQDFTSRLRGFVDIQGLNDDDTKSESVEKPEIVLRRALQLRFILKDIVNVHRPDFIDPCLLNAFLLVPKYKHGARSLRSIVNMCNPLEETLVPMSLPPFPQLEMHVEPTHFHTHLVHPKVSNSFLQDVADLINK